MLRITISNFIFIFYFSYCSKIDSDNYFLRDDNLDDCRLVPSLGLQIIIRKKRCNYIQYYLLKSKFRRCIRELMIALLIILYNFLNYQLTTVNQNLP